jgi:hypothetical protein
MLQRFKRAASGLGITLVPIAALACVQFLLAPYTVAAVGMMDPEIDAWAVSSFRVELAYVYTVVALIIAAYWLLVATLGSGQFLQIKSANIALALSGLTFALAMVIASTVPMPARLFKGACPVLGLSDEQPTFGFDGQSSCEAFANGAVPIVLLGLPLTLLTTSAILRIVVSRRR